MLLDILHHTPTWVFVVLAALVALGLSQARDRQVHEARLVIVPIVMTAFSLCSLFQTFGFAPIAVGAWAAGLGSMAGLGVTLPARNDVRYLPASRTFRVPGSRWPLVAMMTIFFGKYATAVMLALHPAIGGEPIFAIAAGGVCGIASGFFVVRAVRIRRVRARTSSVASAALATA